MKIRVPVLASLAGLVLLTAACDNSDVKPVEYVRAIKSFTVTEVASGKMREFSGIVPGQETLRT
jgi:hypothetical protein